MDQVQLNPFGAYQAGQQMRLQGQEVQNQNALRAALQQYGPAAINGDQNALRELARFDPNLPMELMRQQQGMDLAGKLDARSERTANSGIAVNQVQIEQLRAEGSRAAEQHAMTMKASEREDTIKELTTGMALLSQVTTPEQLEQAKAQWGDMLPEQLRGVTIDQLPGVLEFGKGFLDTLAGPQAPDLMNVPEGNSVIDKSNPQAGPVFTAPQVGQGTDDIKEFEYARQNGYQGSFADWQVERTEDLTTQFRAATPEEAKPYGALGGQIDTKTNRFYPSDTRDTTTGEERKAAGFHLRMKAADGTYNALPADAQQPSLGQRVALGVGIPEGWVLDAEQEVGRQQQIDWIRAKLRAESGAVIGTDEAWEEAAAYFPRAGDSPERKEAKRVSRENANEQLRLMAGRADTSATSPAGTPKRYKWNPGTGEAEPQ